MTRPADRYETVVEANRQYFEQTAKRYDQTETHLQSDRTQRELERDLSRIVAMLGGAMKGLRALDCCAGTGTVTLKLLRAGVETIACDVSPAMLAILEKKASEEGLPARVHLGEVRDFLGAEPGAFDLVVFSSALHHLEDYLGVLDACVAKLKPGGMIFTTFDPTRAADVSFLGRCVQLADYATFKLKHHPLDVPASVVRRLRRKLGKTASSEISSANVGALAEFHVEHGLDDGALAAHLKAAGLEIVWHEREADARFALPRAALRALGDVTTFKLLARRP